MSLPSVAVSTIHCVHTVWCENCAGLKRDITRVVTHSVRHQSSPTRVLQDAPKFRSERSVHCNSFIHSHAKEQRLTSLSSMIEWTKISDKSQLKIFVASCQHLKSSCISISVSLLNYVFRAVEVFTMFTFLRSHFILSAADIIFDPMGIFSFLFF